MAQGPERRGGERRNRGRRSADRVGSDRRRGDRRAAAGVALAVASLGAATMPVHADVYTRINNKGVLEATNIPSSRDFKLTYRSKGTLVHSPGFRLRASSNHAFDAHIEAAAALHGVSRALVRAIIQVESEFDSLAVSTAGAQGLMQLMPATARRFGVTNSFDPRQNIFAGTRYLRVLLDTYGGDVSLSAAAYNAGEGAVARYNGIPPYAETQGYVRKVNALLGGSMEATAAPTRAITPGDRPSAAPPPSVKRPRHNYRWKDANGVVHLEQAPPPTGEYITIRSTE